MVGRFSSSSGILAVVMDLSAAFARARVQLSRVLVASCTNLGSMMGPILFRRDLSPGSSLDQKRYGRRDL